jgi:hypothetical protein
MPSISDSAMTHAALKPDTAIVVDALVEHLREYGARLCDAQFFSMMVQPLYEAYGTAAVDAALRWCRHTAQGRMGNPAATG